MPTTKPRARCRKCSRRLLTEDMYGYAIYRTISYYCSGCLTESVHKDLVGLGPRFRGHYRLVSTPAVVDSWVSKYLDIKSVQQPGQRTLNTKK